MNIYCFIIAITLIGCVEENRGDSAAVYACLKKLSEVEESELNVRSETGLVYYKGNPFTGRKMKYYRNGQIEEVTEYLNGIQNGSLQKWFDNGQLSYEAHFESGKINGESKSWWRNGKLRSVSNHVQGILHGLQLQWYRSGVKFKERNINMGFEEGMQRSWRENGKVYNNYEALNGRIFGLKRANLCYQLDDEEIQFK